MAAVCEAGSMRFATTTFRSTFGRVLSVIVALIAATGLVGFVVAGDLIGLLRFGWSLLLLAAVALALYWLPRLTLSEDEITVVNVFSTVHVPWRALQRVDTKYALTLHTTDGVVTVWASPAPNRYATQGSSRASARIAGDAAGTSPRPGDLLETQSGAAAYLIRRHWDDLREDGMLDGVARDEDRVRRGIHWPTIAVLGALTAATALGLLL